MAYISMSRALFQFNRREFIMRLRMKMERLALTLVTGLLKSWLGKTELCSTKVMAVQRTEDGKFKIIVGNRINRTC